MEVFHFKQFDVINERSSMKVNTDGVLLGAAATLPPGCRSVLDAGTGTGTIALILAQRLADAPDAGILGIDIDLASAEEAAQNFGRSPWAGRLEARHLSLSALDNESGQYDLIVSNPPYVRESERAQMRRNVLDYEPAEALFVPDDDPLRFYRAIRAWADSLLAPGGRIWLEINESLGPETAAVFASGPAASAASAEVIRDLSGKPRFVRVH